MPESVTHLNFNELPFAPEEHVLQAMQEAVSHINHYPEWDSGRLRQALAAHCDTPPEWITVANGSLMIVHQIMIASGQQEVAYAWPSFDDYPAMAQGLRMTIRHTALTAGGSCDLDDLLAHITPDTSLAIICTPNTPTGGIVTHADVEAFLALVPDTVTVLIDEAYGDFARGSDKVRAVELVRSHPNIVVSRSFSKGSGLAGLRVGYAVAQPGLTAKIAAAGVPKFHISNVSMMAALAALEHRDALQQRVEAIVTERERLTTMLRRLGAEVVTGHGNFVWLPLGGQAEGAAAALAEEGVLVRALPPYGVRVSVGRPEDTDRLVDAWQKTLGQQVEVLG
jgi:histidinol-phosphate aminotransferase